LQEPKPQTAPFEEDDEDDVHAWAQAQGVHVIPDEDNNANIITPLADLDEEEEFDVNDQDTDNEEQAVVHPMPSTNNKTL